MLDYVDVYFDLFIDEVDPDDSWVKTIFYQEYATATENDFKKFLNGYKEYFKEKSEEKETKEKFSKELAEEVVRKIKEESERTGIDADDIDETFRSYLDITVF